MPNIALPAVLASTVAPSGKSDAGQTSACGGSDFRQHLAAAKTPDAAATKTPSGGSKAVDAGKADIGKAGARAAHLGAAADEALNDRADSAQAGATMPQTCQPASGKAMRTGKKEPGSQAQAERKDADAAQADFPSTSAASAVSTTSATPAMALIQPTGLQPATARPEAGQQDAGQLNSGQLGASRGVDPLAGVRQEKSEAPVTRPAGASTASEPAPKGALPASANATAATPATPSLPHAPPLAATPPGQPRMPATPAHTPAKDPPGTGIKTPQPLATQRPATPDPSTAASQIAAAPGTPSAGAVPRGGAASEARPGTAAITAQLAGAFPPGAAKSGGNATLHVALTPETLGTITVKIAQNAKGEANVTITASRPETLETLRKDATGLDQLLSNAGLPEANRQIEFHLSPVPATHSGTGLGNAADSAAGNSGHPASQQTGMGFANSSGGNPHPSGRSGAAAPVEPAGALPVIPASAGSLGGVNVIA